MSAYSNSSLTNKPFSDFLGRPAGIDNSLRQAITNAYRIPEIVAVPALITAADLDDELQKRVHALASKTVSAIRAKPAGKGVDGLIHEFSLSSQEGIALMCMAEALLRTPDAATRDLLIADKVAPGNWQSHLGFDRSLFVNAASWGLLVTGKIVAPNKNQNLGDTLRGLIARCGEPVIRAGVQVAMKILGEQYVTGQTISAALKNGEKLEAKGFGYSYDMLGEAATTAADAERYMQDYIDAINAIGAASAGRGVYAGPGISIKLSALHPRYSRAKYTRVMDELLPRIKQLAALAMKYEIGLNIDAEEADRLELSLDLLEALAMDPEFSGWNGIGFVVQAYSKRCPYAIDWIIDLAKRSGNRIMVRLVKGAYWDSEIKRAQVDGLDGFPVYTRKHHTDIAYIACAKKLLAAPEQIFPQFATHNARTMATIYELAGPDFHIGQYEFQCLHGMGEQLYTEVVPADKLNRPCRIYAPVGSHETLLAYLVRRLLENGANSSFVNQIADENFPIDELVKDPVAIARSIEPLGAPHDEIKLPSDILSGPRKNSAGIDLANEIELATLHQNLLASVDKSYKAVPQSGVATAALQPVINPSNHNDQVGQVAHITLQGIETIMGVCQSSEQAWAETSSTDRANMLLRAADIMEQRTAALMAIVMREAGKTASNAIAEIREAVDFLRYYAQQTLDDVVDPNYKTLGTVVCISPWNFPLAIFSGQVAAALVAGNPVVAKPAEETPIIAYEAVKIFHEAGVPPAVLHLAPGAGEVGAALVAHPVTSGVMFTGSTQVARHIQRELASRQTAKGAPIPLIAETGGQNALIVDSSALTEQVVVDVLSSAFDSAGQRCSALRLLCLQEDVYDKTLNMIKGAVAQLTIGNSDRLFTDVGPVITTEARDNINAHIETMRGRGHKVSQLPLPEAASNGTFVAPAIIEITDISELGHEVFGPVLHVVRFNRKDMSSLIASINALGFGLTFGLHTRIDNTIAEVTAQIKAGNIYINRNQIGAVVGVQPFGGHGLSGTGPKAGGPLYLRRLGHTSATTIPTLPMRGAPALLTEFANWVAKHADTALASEIMGLGVHSAIDVNIDLAGPVGETNSYQTHAKGTVFVKAATTRGFAFAVGSALASGNKVLVDPACAASSLVSVLSAAIAKHVRLASPHGISNLVNAVLVEGDLATIAQTSSDVASWDGAIVLVQGVTTEALEAGDAHFSIELLVDETSTSINTAAAGGNASLMAMV